MCTLCPGTPCTFPTRWDPRSSHVFRAVSPVQGHSLTSLQRGDSWAFPWHLQPRHIWVLSNASQFGFVWCFLTREWELCILAGKSQVSSQGTLLGGGDAGWFVQAGGISVALLITMLSARSPHYEVTSPSLYLVSLLGGDTLKPCKIQLPAPLSWVLVPLSVYCFN